MQLPRIINLSSSINTLIPYQRYLDFLQTSRQKQFESMLLCYHQPTITAGIKSKPHNLLATLTELRTKEIAYHKVPRGGDHTAHEPGQLLVYVHLDLRKYNLGLNDFFNLMLDVSNKTILNIWKLQLETQTDAPGLYTHAGQKILSIGVDYRKHITGHGIALNIHNDFSTFQYINPCGLNVDQMTNIKQEVPNFNMQQVKSFKKLWLELFTNQLNSLRTNP